MKKFFSLSTLLRLIAAGLLFYSLARHSYDYYTILRWVTFGVSSYSAFIAWRTQKAGWAWALGLTALLFNPFVPVHLKRELWAYIDTVAATLLLLSVYFIQEAGRVNAGETNVSDSRKRMS